MWCSQFLRHQPYKGRLLLVYDETKWYLACGSQNTKNTLKKISSFKNICKNHVLLTTRRKKKIQQRQISFCRLPIKRSARLANMKAQLTGGLCNVKILHYCQLCERLIISGWILPPDTVGGFDRQKSETGQCLGRNVYMSTADITEQQQGYSIKK